MREGGKRQANALGHHPVAPARPSPGHPCEGTIGPMPRTANADSSNANCPPRDSALRPNYVQKFEQARRGPAPGIWGATSRNVCFTRPCVGRALRLADFHNPSPCSWPHEEPRA
jgi:hypothetical protein